MPKGDWRKHDTRCMPCPTAGVFETKAETVEEFIAELQELQVTECMGWGHGWSQTEYQPIGSLYLFERSYMPWSCFKESTVWWTTWEDIPLMEAKIAAANETYTCHMVEAPYREEGSTAQVLNFSTFEGCARWIWNHRQKSIRLNLLPILVVNPPSERYLELTVRRDFIPREDVGLPTDERHKKVRRFHGETYSVMLSEAPDDVLAAFHGMEEKAGQPA